MIATYKIMLSASSSIQLATVRSKRITQLEPYEYVNKFTIKPVHMSFKNRHGINLDKFTIATFPMGKVIANSL